MRNERKEINLVDTSKEEIGHCDHPLSSAKTKNNNYYQNVI